MEDAQEVQEYFENMQVYFEKAKEERAKLVQAWRKAHLQLLHNDGSPAAAVNVNTGHLAADGED